MVRRMQYRDLGEGQRTVLLHGTEGPVTRESLETQGLKRALHSVTRLKLIDEKTGRTTEAGEQALRDGRYRVELDPLHGAFEENVRILMAHWGVPRQVAIHRAIAQVVKAVEDNQKGDS